MVTEKLKAFLQKKVGSAPPDVDWFARRDRYLAALDQLYSLILDDYLGGAETAGLIEVARSTTTIQEPFVGTYEAPTLLLSIGKQQVGFVPKGSVIAGAAGRVDVIGEAKELSLGWTYDESWVVIFARSPELWMDPLDASSFLDLLRVVMS